MRTKAVFSLFGRTLPSKKHFNYALKRIGIGKVERLKRKLSFHAWRHFLNTLLRMSNVADSKVQSVTGHKTMKMTEHYTHFDTRQFTEIRTCRLNYCLSKNLKKRQLLNY